MRPHHRLMLQIEDVLDSVRANRLVVEVGLASWSMRRSKTSLSGWPELYVQLARDARNAESHEFDSIWLAEHRFWYDGWCPQPQVAAASALSATTRIKVGTAMHLLPQHDPKRSALSTMQLRKMFGARFQLGVGLGFRDEEFDGFGLTRRSRGRRMDEALECMEQNWPDSLAPPDVWIGGSAPAAIERAARRGFGILLPSTLRANEVTDLVTLARRTASDAGRALGKIGMVKDIWIVGDHREADLHCDRVHRHYKEIAGAWSLLGDTNGFNNPELLERQVRRFVKSTLVGRPGEVRDELHSLVDAGVDMIALNVNVDAPPHLIHEQIERISGQLLADLKVM